MEPIDRTTGVVPPVTLGWRLQMALGMGDVTKQRMADALGVNRATVSRWMHDRGAPPRRAYVIQWAAETGVDAQWLAGGGTCPAQPATCPECGHTLAYPHIRRLIAIDPVELPDGSAVAVTYHDVA